MCEAQERRQVYVVCRYGFLGGDDATLAAFTDPAAADAYCALYDRAYGGCDQSYGVESLYVDTDVSESVAELEAIVAEDQRERVVDAITDARRCLDGVEGQDFARAQLDAALSLLDVSREAVES